MFKELGKKLSEVIDPEIGLRITDLGFVYGAEIKNGVAVITITLTTPACPIANYIANDIREKVEELEFVKDVRIELSFDPPWSKEMVSNVLKK